MTHTLSTKRSGTRLALVAGVSATALGLGMAAPAMADPVQGEYTDPKESGPTVHMTHEELGDSSIGTSLFNLELDDGTELVAYCIDFETDIWGGAQYVEGDWAEYPGEGEYAEPGKVHWVLQNAYPNVDVDELGDEAGVDDLSSGDALAGTQAAIWHFSNKRNLTDDNDADVAAVYDYLIEEAEELPSEGEPSASLSFDPKDATGEAGGIIGEFTVDTSADEVPVNIDGPDGVEIVNLDGEAVDTVADGDTFGVSVPEDADPGEATITGITEASADTGRLFKGIEDQDKTQTLILAQSESLEVDSSVQVSWDEAPDEDDKTPPPEDEDEKAPPEDDDKAPEDEDDDAPEEQKPEEGDEADEGELPVTGAQLGGLIAAAVLALGGGAAAIYLARKRRGATAGLEG